MMDIKLIREKVLNNKGKLVGIILILIICALFSTVSTPKMNQPVLINIKEGQTLKGVSNLLKENNLISSKSFFNTYMIITNQDNQIVAGEYEFKNSTNLFKIAHRITTADYGIAVRKITIREGITNREMADLFEATFPKFNREIFETETKNLEGYLFPDTYFFPDNVETETIILTLLGNFEDKMEEVSDILMESNYSLEDIIIMASIIERESTEDGRQEVSNILWKRLKIGMALQVDASFVYERGKSTADLSINDLEEDSPYNTYTRTGLTPTPISNPGLESIKAAANPQPTDNLYFLTGDDGEMYYAKTFEEHKKNKRLYLK